MAFSASRVTVADVATLIILAAGRRHVTVRNRGTTSVFIGAAAVTTATGYELEAGDAVGLELRVNEVIYGIVASGTARVDVAQSDAEPLLG